jgi:hypothetical protein
MLSHFATWLSNTPVSLFIQNELWIIPAVQCAHILAIAVVLSSVAMINLRILGFAGRDTSLAQTAHRHLPWIWSALVVLAITGITLVTGEPERSIVNPSFQLKMALLLVAMICTVAFQLSVYGPGQLPRPGSDRLLKIAGVAVLLLWFAIAVAGRWIAYTTLSYGQ